MLDPDRVTEHHDQFGLFPLHFGFGAQGPAALSGLVAALRGYGKPLIHTVHDLRDPHRTDPAPHLVSPGVLIPVAGRPITLTSGAAAEIAARWNRTATALPHPHVVEPPRLGRPKPPRDGFRVGVHAKSPRPDMAFLPVARVLAETPAELPADTEPLVNIHREAGDPSSHAYAPGVLKELEAPARCGLLTPHVHDCFDEEQSWDCSSGLDVSVLPYSFGTHSGRLEACYDLGTTVITPSRDFYALRRPCLRPVPGRTEPPRRAVSRVHAAVPR